MNNSIAEEIEKLNKEKVRIESELDIYRNDYLTLTTCEDELARIYSIAENSDYTLEYFSASINSFVHCILVFISLHLPIYTTLPSSGRLSFTSFILETSIVLI